jgi:Fur family peroxide stress response transcriptional regulator
MKQYLNLTMEQFIQRCKENELKITPQRITIFQELSKTQGHPTTEKIYKAVKKRFPGISFDTVNRTLLTFAELAIVNIVEGTGDPKRFDTNPEPHHHFRCIRCDLLEDFTFKGYDNLNIPRDLSRRFKIINKRVVLEGLCEKCKGRI